MENKKGFKYFLRVGGTLFAIAAIMAFALAMVNGFTAERIEANATAETNASIAEVFGEGIDFTTVEGDFESPVKTVYEVKRGDEMLGWAVACAPMGFKAEIDMIVGVAPDGTCLAVKVVSLSETPGLGAKIAEEEFLSQYIGKSGTLEVKVDIDEVASATISSVAANSAVNASLAVVAEIMGGEAQ